MGFVMKGFPMLGDRNKNGKIEGWEKSIKNKIEAKSKSKPPLAKKCNCWDGYKRVPGTKPCAKGSCTKA